MEKNIERRAHMANVVNQVDKIHDALFGNKDEQREGMVDQVKELKREICGDKDHVGLREVVRWHDRIANALIWALGIVGGATLAWYGQAIFSSMATGAPEP